MFGMRAGSSPSSTSAAAATSLMPPSIQAASMVGDPFCCCSLASVVLEVPISGTTLIPVALVKGSATQALNASPQLPPYQATVIWFCACNGAAKAVKASATAAAGTMFERTMSPPVNFDEPEY